MTTTQRLRDLLRRPGLVPSLGAHDVFTARLLELAGVELIFLGGFGASASLLGLPDVGYITLPEMADAARRTALRLTTPIIVDGDTGHGDLHNVARTVREFEQAGAAGVLLEDQVAPKRCGHFEGKAVIPVDEMVLKLTAALDARRDPDFVIIARTDARAVEGLNAAIDRAGRYAEAGADVCFVEAPRSREELEAVVRAVPRPLLANMLTGGATPILGLRELEQLGYKIGVLPIETLLATAAAVRKLTRTFLEQGRVDEGAVELATFAEVKEVLGLEEVVGLRARLTGTR